MPRITNTVGVAGWIFADLLLALTMIFVAISAPDIAPLVGPPPSLTPPPIAPEPSPTATASPTPAPPPQDVVLLRSVCRKVFVNPQGATDPDALVKALSDLGTVPVRLKLVYAYGVWPDDGGTGTVLARRVTDLLRSESVRSRLGSLLLDGDQILVHNFRAIPGAGDNRGDVYLEMYLAAQPGTRIPASTASCPN